MFRSFHHFQMFLLTGESENFKSTNKTTRKLRRSENYEDKGDTSGEQVLELNEKGSHREVKRRLQKNELGELR